MLKLYGNRISVNVRRVWIALLEKQIPFEFVTVQLDGDQLTPEFSEVNRLQRVPVLEDDGFRVVESIAILDYLEATHPEPALMPTDAKAIATVRMAEIVGITELQPAFVPLTRQLVGLEESGDRIEIARRQVTKSLQFYEHLLGGHSYFGGETFTLGDIVAGTLIPSATMFGFDLAAYPGLAAWVERLNQRDSWQQTTPQTVEVQVAIPNIKRILERRL